VRRAAGLIAATLAAAVALAACGGGSSGLLAPSQAAILGNDLSALEDALTSHSCSATQSALSRLGNSLANLPASVDGRLRSNLQRGYVELNGTAPKQCHAHHGHTHRGGATSQTGATHATGSTQATGPTESTGTTESSGPTETTGPTESTGPSLGPGGGQQAPTGPSGSTSNGDGGVVSG
jgi:hypothetical protein